MHMLAAGRALLCLSSVWGTLPQPCLARDYGGSDPASQGRDAATESCEARTVNYITHTLPQQCLLTSWSAPAATPLPASDGSPAPPIATGTGSAAADISDAQQAEKSGGETTNGDAAADNQDLATSSFMSFEEWKELQLKKAGQDPNDLKTRKHHERERDDGSPHQELDSIGDDGEINFDFDALSDKVSEITASGGSRQASGGGGGADGSRAGNEPPADAKEEVVLYDGDGTAQYIRSKDAGKTCKERFSYASFDAGATVLKTGPRAKNAKAILVENKDSYMLLECAQPNKFVIIELSDDILVDTVVIANFEFFSSMVRTFRVSVSGRYPVKLEKWKVLGTFEARNQRDIQAFLVEHPQIWAKYIRLEFLTHYGSEYYCPISLVRVHGTRMIDSWKEAEGGRDDDEEGVIDSVPHGQQDGAEPPDQSQRQQPETAVPTQTQEPTKPHETPLENRTEPASLVVTEMGLSPWRPIFREFASQDTCEMPTPTPAQSVGTGRLAASRPAAGPHHGFEPAASTEGSPHAISTSTTPGDLPSEARAPPPGNETLGDPAASAYMAPSSATSPASQHSPIPSAHLPREAGPPASSTHRARPEPPHSGQPKSPTSVSKPSSQAANKAGTPSKASSAVPSSSARNRTGTNTAAAVSASPTVQESFFKTVAKRLQLLESNTSLSLQYIEDQSRFLREALTKMERKQITRVDAFLDRLNRTVLAELRSVRQQYDQIWQSTVIALESQRDQSEREIVALSSRLNLLADEVVFQKRMAILQSLLLLACLGLIVFSRGFGGPATTTFPVPSSSSVSASRGWPTWPSSPPPPASPAGPPMRDSAYEPGSPTFSASPSPPRSGPLGSTGSGTPRAPRAPPAHIRLQSTVYADKTLPLTPTSDYGSGRDAAPSIHVADEDGASYYDDTSGFETPQRSDNDVCDTPTESTHSGDGAVAAAAIQPEPVPLRPVDGPVSDEVDQIRGGAGGRGGGGDGGSGGCEPNLSNSFDEESRPPLTRTGLSQFGDSRKPLPALPEDASPA